jgi:hypothetical protein
MSSKRLDPSDPDVRAQHRQWLQNWQRVGAVLEAERWTRLATMTGSEAQRMTRDLLDVWRRGMTGDNAEGLLLCQRVFARARPAGRRA